MVSVIRGEVGTALDTNRNSICCSVEDTTKESETTTTTTSPQSSDSITVDHSEGSSRTNELQNENGGDEDRPQSSRQKLNEERIGAFQNTSSPPVRGVSVRISQTASRDTVELSERTQRSCVTEKSTSDSVSHLEPTNFRRPNLSYASAVSRSNNTSRTVAQEDKSIATVDNTSESEKSAQTSSSSHQRRKLPKQMTLDESWSTPIFVGAADDDYFENAPSPSSSQFYKPLEEKTRRASAEIITENSEAVEPVDRPQSLPVIEASSSFDHTAAESSKSDSQPTPVTSSDAAELNVPASSAHDKPPATTLQAGSSVTLQPILVDAPDIDEINDLRPVRELLPERTPGAPAVVRVENHPYAGVVPSRARQLVRSMAMCGDDDTRLRPPPPSSMLKTYASVAAIGLPGVAPRHRNSSSLSRESSSYTDYPTDLTEPELRAFIAATLHKNPRDRAVILHLEQTFIDLLNNFEQQSLKLPPVSSYTRMLIHRVAVLFGLDHNVDNSGKRVVVSKTSKSKPPSFLFASLIQSNVYTDNQKYDGSWNYGDQKAQSFDTSYIMSPLEYESSLYQPWSWTSGSNKYFEKTQQYYPLGYVHQGPVMRKAGSFSGVPAFYRSGSRSAENYDRLQNINGQAHSLTSSTYLSPREPIDEAAERMNNLSFSDRASQMSFRSISSTQAAPPGVPVGYPAVYHYQMGDDMGYAPYQHQPIYVQPSPLLASPSMEVYAPHSTVMMPVQPNAPLQPSASMIACQQAQDSMSNESQSVQDPSLMAPIQQPECVPYTTQQYSAQMVGCPPQGYQTVPQTVYPAQYQQVVYPQQYEPVMRQVHQLQPNVMQQAYPPMATTVMQAAQQYPTPMYHPPAHPQMYQSPMFHSQMPQQVVHVQSPIYQQPPRPAMVPTAPQPQQQYVEVPNAVQQQPPLPSYQQMNYGQWSSGMSCSEDINEVEENSEVTEASEMPTPLPALNMISARMGHGKPMMNPLSVLVHTEPMYHYSQTSPVMSSMQQQQMMQMQCHSRPLLYKATEQCSGTQNSVDGGYCSMTQESIRDGELANDAQ